MSNISPSKIPSGISAVAGSNSSSLELMRKSSGLHAPQVSAVLSSDDPSEPGWPDDDNMAARSRKNTFYNLAVDIGQAHFSSTVTIRQPFMVEPHQMKNCGMQVMHVDLILDSKEAEIVRGSPSQSALHTTTG